MEDYNICGMPLKKQYLYHMIVLNPDDIMSSTINNYYFPKFSLPPVVDK